MQVQDTFDTGVKVFLVIVALSIFLIFSAVFNRFLFFKEYYFFVEAPCDTDVQACYVRDCDDYCPPNGFEVYTTYRIKASDFQYCSDNTCQNVCSQPVSNDIECVEVLCDPEVADCSV